MKIFLNIINQKGSKSAKKLAEAAGLIRRWKVKNVVAPNRQLYWGNSYGGKLATFQVLPFEITVPWTYSAWTAKNWVMEENKTVVARTLLNSSCGKGIVILKDEDDFSKIDTNKVKLYTQYIKKSREFRVHMLGDHAFHIAEKKLKVGNKPHPVRSHGNGYVFCTENLEDIPAAVEKVVAELAHTHAIGGVSFIDNKADSFRAVDIIYNKHYDRAYILEINTSPGLEGVTLDAYVKEIKRWASSSTIAPAPVVDLKTTEPYIKMEHGVGDVDGLKVMHLAPHQLKLTQEQINTLNKFYLTGPHLKYPPPIYSGTTTETSD